jgi:hypothetical protein
LPAESVVSRGRVPESVSNHPLGIGEEVDRALRHALGEGALGFGAQRAGLPKSPSWRSSRTRSFAETEDERLGGFSLKRS